MGKLWLKPTAMDGKTVAEANGNGWESCG